MEDTAYSTHAPVAISGGLPGQWRACSICFTKRLGTSLLKISYRIKTIRNALRTLEYCDDSLNCAAIAAERKRMAEV